MLRRVAVELEGGQRRLIRSAEEQLEKMLSLQLQPMRGFLLSFARYARELARSLQREVEVELEGEETRLDRRIARELEEALLHLVRNSVDHGIESPEVREARGKPRAGRIRIKALADGPRVRLIIEDDGGGIDIQRVLQHAVEVGLVDAATAAGMGKKEALRLLFAPGFSTRKQVSEISGRGVGLDVVATAVNRVGGEVFVETEPRRGTTFILEVPVARRGESVMLLRVGQLAHRPAGRGGAPGDADGCRRRGRARRPDAGDAGRPAGPLRAARPALRPAARRQPAPARGGGLGAAARHRRRHGRGGGGGAGAADHPAGAHRPAARRGGAARLRRAGGGALAVDAVAARVPAGPAGGAAADGDPPRARAAGGRLAGHPRDGAPAAGGRRLRGGARRGRRGGAVAARRGELRLRGHRHRDAAHGRLRACSASAGHGALRPPADHRRLDARPPGGPPARPQGGRRRLSDQAEPGRRRAGGSGAAVERESKGGRRR